MPANALHRQLLLYEAVAAPAAAKSINFHFKTVLSQLTLSITSWLTQVELGPWGVSQVQPYAHQWSNTSDVRTLPSSA
jgi:hypothetical protein